MPRVSNPALADFISLQGTVPSKNGTENRNFRITHKFDVVPNLIPLEYFRVKSRHVSPSYFITTDNIRVPTAGDINIVNGTSDSIVGTLDLTVTLGAHAFYFNLISACSASPFATTITQLGFVDVDASM
jgi:hypothetical protein